MVVIGLWQSSDGGSGGCSVGGSSDSGVGNSSTIQEQQQEMES